MKKFMRIALVFALAGATLVGCTKDYSGDISDLNKKVTEQASALSALQTQVGAAQTAADAAAQKAAEALAEAQKKASSADVQAAEERVNAKINDLVNGDVKALKDAVAALEGIKAGERLTDLETAIKDFVTKAEFAQELAALKDELTAAIAAGDKANADAIAALEKKVEDILAGLSITDVKVHSATAITAAYGKFTAKGVENAAKWKGPKADEIATIKKGDFVFGTGANEIIVQVNPAGADITDAEISLQTSECTEAPIVFGTPVPCEKLKSENGLWSLPFVVEEFTEDEAKEISNEFNGAKMALVVNGVRTDYDMTFGLVEGKTTNAKPVAITEKVAEASGEGTFVFAPADAPQILDAYITDVADADSLRYGITYDGMSFTYDVEKVQKRIEATDRNVEITFKVSYMNLVGGVCDGKTAKEAKLTIERKAADPVAATVYQFATVAAHDAVAAYTGTGVSAADYEKSRNAQSFVISFKEFYDEFAPTKAEKELWLEDWATKAITYKYWTATEDDYGTINLVSDVTANLVDVAKSKLDNATKTNLTIKFAEDYGNATFDEDELFAAEVTFTNDDDEIIQAVVPFKINAPSADEMAKWYNWNELHCYKDGVLYVDKDVTSGNPWTYIRFKQHFAANDKYNNVVLVAPVTPVYKANVTPAAVDYYTTGAVLPTFTAAEEEAMKDMDSAAKETYKTQAAYGANLNTDFRVFEWDVANTDKFLSAPGANGVYQRPYYKFAVGAVPAGYTNLMLVYRHNNAIADKYLNTNITLSGLKITAMGGRTFDIPTLTFQVVGAAPTAVNSISFTKDIELGRATGTFVDLYNALYTPNSTTEEYYGAYTFADENGQKLIIKKTGNNWPSITERTTYTVDEETGEPSGWIGGYGTAYVDAKVFSYNSQINKTSELTTEVGGIQIKNMNLNELPVDVDTVYVEFSIPAQNMVYVLNGSQYNNGNGDYEVIFTIKVK